MPADMAVVPEAMVAGRRDSTECQMLLKYLPTMLLLLLLLLLLPAEVLAHTSGRSRLRCRQVE